MSARETEAAAAPLLQRHSRGGFGPVLLASVLLGVVALAALTAGTASIPPATALSILASHVSLVGRSAEVSPAWERIVLDVRLPRVLSAGLVGAALAYAGATYQGVFRNPLADPFLLGVASGAALG